MEMEFLKQFVNLTGIGLAGLALYALILLLKKKNNKDYQQLNKKVNNEIEHRLQSIEDRLRDVENEVVSIKGDVGYLKGRLNSKNK